MVHNLKKIILANYLCWALDPTHNLKKIVENQTDRSIVFFPFFSH